MVRVAACLLRISIGLTTMSYVGSRTIPTMEKPLEALSIRLVGSSCGYCEGYYCLAVSICPDDQPVPDRFPVGQQHH